ncbi:DUF5681 domain-containing protein [Parachlamydia acanthamoebae]|uniref:DUF5681 domain-containing protein n=1 Tax=Parachlamydia acanthamoebae TaxID=83552 RepID=UPI00075125EE|nr:DUF5681 domain-containing protein [Parachlamydia acanthamoebae]
MPDNTDKKQKIRYQKGQSGNPKGRPKGSRNRASLMAEHLFIADVESICKAVIEKAKAGDMYAAKIILDRLLPPKKDGSVNIQLPEIATSHDVLKAIQCVTQAIANGNITPSEGEVLARILNIHATAIELYEFEHTLNELEQKRSKI